MDKPIAYIINEGVSDAVECEIVNENDKFVIAEGILQEAEKINRNRRYYSTDDLHKEIYGDRIRELVTSGNFKGEAGHPLDLSLTRQQKVDPTLEQVWFTKLWMDGPYVKAQFRGTNNQLGKAFNQDLKDGQKPSFSLRSLGSIRNVNGRMNVTNLRIICYDRVYYPSYDNAYTDHIVDESAGIGYDSFESQLNKYQDFIRSKGNIQSVSEGFESIAPIMNDDIMKIIMKESYDFNSICEQFNPFYKSISLTKNKDSVMLVDENYNTIIVPLKKYVRDQIMHYCGNL